MSILDRLQLLVRSEVGAVTRRPERRAEIRRTLGDARESLVDLRRNERAANTRYQDALDRQADQEQLAVQALRRGDEAGAQRILRDKQAVDREVERLRDLLDRHQAELEDLRSALDALRYRVEASNDRDDRPPPPPRDTGIRHYRAADPPPLARRPVADTRDRLERDAAVAVDFGALGDASDRFEDLESRISGLEAEVSGDLWLDDNADPLADRFRRLELGRLERAAGAAGDAAGSALDRLRRRMKGDDT